MSDGSILFYYDHLRSTRVSDVTYGIFCHIPFDPTVPDHESRPHKTFTSISGLRRINDFFEVILPKVFISFVISLPVSDWSVCAGYANFGDHGVQKIIFPGIPVEGRVQGSFFYLVVLPGCLGHSEVERRRHACVFLV